MSERSVHKFKKVELQNLLWNLGSIGAVEKLLDLQSGTFSQYVRKHNLTVPVQRVRAMKTEELLQLLCLHGSLAKMGKALSVSAAFLKSEFSARGYGDVKAFDFSKRDIQKDIEKVGSQNILASMYNCTLKELKAEAELRGIDLSSFTDQTKLGRHESGKGRTAEIAYAEYRGDQITKDMNQEESIHADYDFEDADFGRVDVKSSKKRGYKSEEKRGTYSWRISLGASLDCDHVAAVLYDSRYGKVEHILIIPMSECQGKSGLTIRSTELGQFQKI